jgi:hypothetical protein
MAYNGRVEGSTVMKSKQVAAAMVYTLVVALVAVGAVTAWTQAIAHAAVDLIF